MIKPKLWAGQDLKGLWHFTRKLDGVRMLRDEHGNPVSRRGKPLHNLDLVPEHIVDAEVYLGDWDTTVSAVRTHNSTLVDPADVYCLDPTSMDTRLRLYSFRNPTAAFIRAELSDALRRGDEGLVLYSGDWTKALKVKPFETHDVPVTGATEGKGKYAGLIGALITPRGKVSGMTDDQRRAFTNKLPSVIEVECMSLTKNGMFRHPRFVRERFDKSPADCI